MRGQRRDVAVDVALRVDLLEALGAALVLDGLPRAGRAVERAAARESLAGLCGGEIAKAGDALLFGGAVFCGRHGGLSRQKVSGYVAASATSCALAKSWLWRGAGALCAHCSVSVGCIFRQGTLDLPDQTLSRYRR